MEANPYVPPTVATPLEDERRGTGTAAAVWRIRLACAGVMLYVAYEIGLLVVRSTPATTQRLVEVMLVIPGLLTVGAIGTCFRSRTSALLMLAVAVLPRIAYWTTGRWVMPSVSWILMVAACCLAVFATFEVHSRK